MGRLFVIGAPSGTGKTCLLGRLLASIERLRFSVSHTTRTPRPGEADGVNYHFVARDTFEAEAARGGFLEWAEVYGNLYGTHRAEVERAQRDDVDLVLDLDVQGARSVRQAVPTAILVLILPPSWKVLEDRLRSRGTEDERARVARLREGRAQLNSHAIYDYAVVNDDLERAARDLEAIVRAERSRVTAAAALLAELGATS